MGRSEVIDRGPGIGSLLADLEALEETGLEVGWFEPELAQVVLLQEMGTRRQPARPFIRRTMAAKRRGWGVLAAAAVDAQLAGAPPQAALAPLGERIAEDLRRGSVNLRTPPNDPDTVDAKGSSNPLVDTGALQDGVDHRVRRRS